MQCDATRTFGDVEVMCAREQHGVEEPPRDRMIEHVDVTGTIRWSNYPPEVMESFRVRGK
jgi:hypothetical protein